MRLRKKDMFLNGSLIIKVIRGGTCNKQQNKLGTIEKVQLIVIFSTIHPSREERNLHKTLKKQKVGREKRMSERRERTDHHARCMPYRCTG